MGYGFAIVTGSGSAPLVPELMDAITEVRVEEELSKPTRFAIRFDEDLCEGEPATLRAGSLRSGEILGVIAWTAAEEPICLVQGPITRMKSSMVTGGPGSWLEVHGEDLRKIMDRETVNAAWEGLGSDIASAVHGNHGFDLLVTATTRP